MLNDIGQSMEHYLSLEPYKQDKKKNSLHDNKVRVTALEQPYPISGHSWLNDKLQVFN